MTYLQFFIDSWFVFVVASAIAYQYFRRNVRQKVTVDLQGSLKSIGESLIRVERHLDLKAQDKRLREPKEATRVYGVLAQRGVDTRFIIQPANTFEEMSDIVFRELGPGWIILMSGFCDALGWAPKIEPKQQVVVEPPIASFIHGLEYSRDKFADTPAQKKALESIIKKIKEQHHDIARS